MTAADAGREKLFPDVVNFSSKLDLPPSWHRPRVRLREMSSASSIHGHQAELAVQLRSQFTRLQDEGNLVPWVLPAAQNSMRIDKSSGAFPPLIDSFQEASKIYRRSPLSRFKRDALKSKLVRRIENCKKGILDGSQSRNGHKLQGVLKDSPARVHRRVDDSWAILDRALATEKASKLINDYKWELRNFSCQNSQDEATAASMSSGPAMPPPRKIAECSCILARELAKERARKFQCQVPPCNFPVGSKSIIKLETPPGKSIGQSNKVQILRACTARPQGKEAEVTSQILTKQSTKVKTLRASTARRQGNQRETMSPFARPSQEKDIEQPKNGHAPDVEIPATVCLKIRNGSISSGVSSRFGSTSPRQSCEAEFVLKRRCPIIARGHLARATESRLMNRFKGEDLSVPDISSSPCGRQHDSSSRLFFCPTISSQCKARSSNINARALLKERELKLFEDVQLKKREVLVQEISRPVSHRRVADCSKSRVSVSPSRSSPSKHTITSQANHRMPGAAMERQHKSPKPKKIKPERPIGHNTKQLGKFQDDDSLDSLAIYTTSKEDMDDHLARREFSVCNRSSDPPVMARVCEQSLTNMRALRVIERIIDDNNEICPDECMEPC